MVCTMDNAQVILLCRLIRTLQEPITKCLYGAAFFGHCEYCIFQFSEDSLTPCIHMFIRPLYTLCNNGSVYIVVYLYNYAELYWSNAVFHCSVKGGLD